MKDRFLKDLGIYGLTTMMVRLINFILIPVYARVLSQKEYGTMDLVTTITYVTSVFIFLELYQAVARFYAEA
ncbi:MAG: oligosaccharide flippase family protein [Saprospiraceae bacterium]|nr:oligosaccharide flippase family protein [Saprospiraceae bacterium]